MCLKKLHPFNRMLLGAFGGGVSGMIAGLLLSSLIYWISQQFTGPMSDGPDMRIATFIGMGLGTVIGSILGATAINKE